MIKGKLITANSIVVNINNKTHTVAKSHVNYEQVKTLLKDPTFNDGDALLKLIDVTATVNEFGQGKVVVKDGSVLYNGEIIHSTLTERILDMISEGFNVDPMVKFMENLMDNPSKRAVDELYLFLEACSLPITDDGHFLAYKKVTRVGDKLVDIYTRKMDNSVGQLVKLNHRNKVDEDRNRTCSNGLHFCSESYLQHYGGGANDVVVVVKINPADVVAIPADYKNAKGRAWKYEILEELTVTDYKKAFTKTVDTNYKSKLDTTGRDYQTGYEAGKAKAKRHNARGFADVMTKVDTTFGDGYWTGYNDYIHSGLPKTKPVVNSINKTTVSPQRKRGPDGRFV